MHSGIPFSKKATTIFGSLGIINENTTVSKSLSTKTKIAGKTVPILHFFGKHNLQNPGKLNYTNPHIRDLFLKSNKLQKAKIKAALGIMGEDTLHALLSKSGVYTEKIIVEKYKEIDHIPGYTKSFKESNGVIEDLCKRGYSKHQIGQKTGMCRLQEVSIHHGKPVIYPVNTILDEGGDIMWDLITASNVIDYFSTDLAQIGIGTSNKSPSPSDIELYGKPIYVSMDATYPATNTTRRADFKGTFGDGSAQQSWQEFSIKNKTDQNLIRATADKGIKSSGETWSLELQITFA